MNNFTKYSNSWGHLLMSIVLILTGLVLILATGDATMKGVGVTLIMTSSGYWFVSSVATHGPGPHNRPESDDTP